MRKKKIAQQDIIGQQGINLIERIVLGMGCLWHPTKLEAGIDGILEIRDSTTGEVTNSILQVQSKATEKQFVSESDASFTYTCSERDLEYWLNGNAPVILVRSRPATQEAYWVSIKDYFADTDRRRARKVVFDKQKDRFDIQCRERLAALAIPRDSGIYLAPLPKHETLVSNLLSVSFAKYIYRAQTDLRIPRQVWWRLEDATDDPQPEWALHGDAIFSFHDLSQPPWDSVCNSSSVHRGDSSGWAASPIDSARHVFVQLLNVSLGRKAHLLGLRWSKAKECYFVIPPRNLADLSLGKRGTFTAYLSKKDPNRVAFYRHAAFEPQFYRHDNHWYLEITPTYYFTRDGVRLDGFYEERLAGKKRMERNSAVVGQVKLWADYLSQQQTADMFTPPYPFLTFGSLASFDVDFGIVDEVWRLPKEEDDSDAWLFEQ